MTPNGSDPTTTPRSAWTIAPISVAAGVLAVLIRIPTYLASTHLSFDDGVYGASAVAMRNGGMPFHGVFSSQGPLFLPLVYLADLVGFRTQNSPRILAVLSGALVAGFVAAIAGRIDPDASVRRRRIAAGVAGVLAAISGALWWTTGPLTSDGPTVALGCAAIWCAMSYRARPRLAMAVTTGVLLGAAVGVKLVMAAPAIAICLLFALVVRRWRHLGAAAAALVAVPLVATLAFGPADVWREVVDYHLKSQVGSRNPLVHLRKLGSTLLDRDLLITIAFLIAVVALIIVAVRRRSTSSPTGTWIERATAGLTPIGLWLTLTVAVLAIQQPLWRNHVSYVIAPMVIVVGVVAARGGLAALAITTAALLTLPYQVVHTRPMWDPQPYSGSTAEIVRALRALPPGAQAISDDPGLVWRADRRMPDNFVDTSVLRITSPLPGVAIGSATVINAAATPEVCAVVVTSPDRFGALPLLAHLLDGNGYEQTVQSDNGLGLWVKQDCRSRVRARR